MVFITFFMHMLKLESIIVMGIVKIKRPLQKKKGSNTAVDFEAGSSLAQGSSWSLSALGEVISPHTCHLSILKS